MKKYLEYRLKVDQITKDSLGKEQTHMRYVLQWAEDLSFLRVTSIRPTLTEYLLSARLDIGRPRLSALYIKKVLSTARSFFTWLSDYEHGYRHIKQSWIKTLRAKRLSDAPKNQEVITLEEILAIASQPVYTIFERRTRAALVFLYLSGMRVGAFVSLPIQAVDIPNRLVNQFPSLGVKTKNRKFATTYLLDIPELLQVVQEWDNEVRSILPPNGFWFAPLSFRTGKIDPALVEVGEHRRNLARRNFKQWLQREGLSYYSPHKFRHGHIHYGLLRSKNIADFKAVSLNAMHSNIKITDQFYSVLDSDEVQDRINSLNKKNTSNNQEEFVRLLEGLLSQIKQKT